MNHPTQDRRSSPLLGPREILQLLRNRRWTWIVPTVVITLLAAVFAIVKPREWEAKQALFVRQEAAGAPESNGRFGSLSEMKKLQETILELAKSRRVLSESLETVGPLDSQETSQWPTEDDIDTLRDNLMITPPKGAEFGSTEVFYLVIRDQDRERAVHLVSSVCDHLEHRLQELRDSKARSLVDELARSVSLAEESLAKDTDQLATFELSVGADLAELRMLHGSPSGNSDLRQQQVSLENDIRRYEAERQRNQELLSLLLAAQKDPGSLVASPNSLLRSQPALRSLKDGLVASQLKTAQLQGSMTDQHPRVLAAMEAEREIREHVHNELELAIRGVTVDLKLDTDRIAQLRQRLDSDHQKLIRIAGMRAAYSNLVSAVDNRTTQLQSARSELAEAEAQSAASQSASLMSRIDSPEEGTHPVGPGRAQLTLAGAFGGLMTGFGLVFLTTGPLLRNQGRRAQDSTPVTQDWESVNVDLPSAVSLTRSSKG